MKFDSAVAKSWLKNVAVFLPHIDRVIRETGADTLVIGAGVFDIYHAQGWVPEFKRKTGDLDLSIGLVQDTAAYEKACLGLIGAGYIQHDAERRYRFFPNKKNPGGPSYVDLLAHPASAAISNVSAARTRAAMGVGAEFSFGAMAFAMREKYEIDDRIFCPNPLAFAAMKIRSYEDDPNKRRKDLADLAELAWGLVEKGSHFEMNLLWQKLKTDSEAQYVRQILAALGDGNRTAWDIDDARADLVARLFTTAEIDELIPRRFSEWVEYLPYQTR
jgi:hypothetical protein